MFAGEYCNRDVSIIGKNDSVIKAAKLMRVHHVGDLIVVESRDGERAPIGILTERDIVIEVIAEEVPLNEITVENIMNFRMVTAKENDDLMTTIKRMRINGLRRIPVVNQAGGLVGILSTNDILDVVTEQLIDIDQILVNEQSKEKDNRSVFSHH